MVYYSVPENFKGRNNMLARHRLNLIKGIPMTQKELIDNVHAEITGKKTFKEIIHLLTDAIVQEGENNLKILFSRLEPASSAYVHAYPDDISDGPWNV